MEDISKRLITIKEKISSAQTKLDQAEGREDGLKDQLKEFNCTTVKQANKMIKELDEKILENEDELDKGLKGLETIIKEIENEM